MNLTPEQLKAIEDLAFRLITPDLVAINLGVDELDFVAACRTPGTEERNAYYKGYLKQIISTREAIIKAATNGSNPAQSELLQFMKEVSNRLKYE